VNKQCFIGALIFILISSPGSAQTSSSVFLTIGKGSIDGGEFRMLSNIAQIFAGGSLPLDTELTLILQCGNIEIDMLPLLTKEQF